MYTEEEIIEFAESKNLSTEQFRELLNQLGDQIVPSEAPIQPTTAQPEAVTESPVAVIPDVKVAPPPPQTQITTPPPEDKIPVKTEGLDAIFKQTYGLPQQDRAFGFTPSTQPQQDIGPFSDPTKKDPVQGFFEKVMEEEKDTDFKAINPDVTWGELGEFVGNRFKNFIPMTKKALVDPVIALGDFVGLEKKDFMRAAQRYSMSVDEEMDRVRQDDPESIKKAIQESANKTIPSRYEALGVGVENLAQIAPGLGYGKVAKSLAGSKPVSKLFPAKPKVSPQTGRFSIDQGFSDKATSRIGGATAGLALASGQIQGEVRSMTRDYLTELKDADGKPLYTKDQIEEIADDVVDKALYISGLPNAALSAFGLGPAFRKLDDSGVKQLFKAALKAGVTDMVFESIQEPFQGYARDEALRQDIDPSIDPLDPSKRVKEGLLSIGPGFVTGATTSVGGSLVDKSKNSLDNFLVKRQVKKFVKSLEEGVETEEKGDPLDGSLAKPRTMGEPEDKAEEVTGVTIEEVESETTPEYDEAQKEVEQETEKYDRPIQEEEKPAPAPPIIEAPQPDSLERIKEEQKKAEEEERQKIIETNKRKAEEEAQRKEVEQETEKYDRPIQEEPEKTVDDRIKEAVKTGDRNEIIKVRREATTDKEKKEVEQAVEKETVSDTRSIIEKKRAEKKRRLEELKKKKAEKKPLQARVEGTDEDADIDEDPEIAELEAELREETYREILEKEKSIPAQQHRSSDSMGKQQYSTPPSIAFLAQELGRAEEAQTVYEPTAGHGSLVSGADPEAVTANEIDPDRRKTLEESGFKVTDKDASEELAVPEKSQDLVIMNPPFGKMDEPKKIEGYTIKKLDHWIAVNNLQAMKDSGRAVLILGANLKKDNRLGDTDKVFFNYLYSNYNIADHFEIDGKLYSRLGATQPIHMITIAGRREKAEFAPTEPLERIENHNDLYERFKEAYRLSKRIYTDTERGVQRGTGRVDEESTAEGVDVSGSVEGRDAEIGKGRKDIDRGAGRVDREPDESGSTSEDRGKRGADDRGVDEDRRGEGETGRLGDTGEQASEQGTEGEGEGVVGERENVVEVIRDNAIKEKNIKDVSAEELLAPYTQVQSEGTSQNINPDPLIPANMVEGIKNSLKNLVKKVGPLDEFLMKELGYTKDELFDSLFAVQIDSVAMAIDQMKKGHGFVVGDQTGLGKGRQAAAILRWAKRQGKIPIFVTSKANLFTPIYQDGLDIKENFRPFVMNNNAQSKILDKNKRVVVDVLGPKEYEKAWKNIEQGKLPEGTDQIFTTYSQFQAKMVGDKENKKRSRFKNIASNAIFILDEMHNAAGQSNTNAYFMELLKASRHNGTAYFSATFAKTPKNLPLLFTTDLSKATDGNIPALVELLKEGGLPLQRLISAALSDAGQLVNRQTSFKGIDVTIKTPDTSTEEGKAQARKETELSDKVTSVIRGIRAFNKMILGDIVIYEKELQQERGVTIRDANGKTQNSLQVSSTNFSAIFHNLVSQFLLSTKVSQTVEEAVASHKANEKTIITLQNTMGSFLDDVVESDNLKEGDSITGFTWNRLIDRNIDKAMTITLKDARDPDKTEKILMPIEKLNPVNRAVLEQLRAEAKNLNIGDLSVSPIDKLRQDLEDAGVKTSEITGRKWRIDYSTSTPTLTQRTAKEKQNARIVQDYQDGKIDSVVINKSGAEGVSLHAKKGIRDIRKRHTIVIQPNPDINDQVQLMGRGNRVGQVVLPKITILTSTLPSERRPTAILVGKLESLNANTAANSQSALSFDASNIFNEIGDEVIENWLEGNPDIAQKIGAEDKKASAIPGELVKKITGQMAIMPVEMQELFWEEIGEAYRNEISHLNETGDNPLDTQFRDLDAKLKGPEIVVVEETDKNSAFGKAAKVALYDIKKDVQFTKPKDALKKVLEAYGITEEEYQKGTKNEVDENKAWINSRLDAAGKIAIEKEKELYNLYEEAKKADDKKTMSSITNRIDKLNIQFMSFQHEVKRHYPGKMWVLNLGGETMTGLVTEVSFPGFKRAGGNPFALSQNIVKMIRSDGYPPISLPMSKIKDGVDLKKYEEPIISYEDTRTLEEVFSFKPEETSQRENKYIISGNLIKGIGSTTVKGKIIDYSDDKGNRLQGIILPKTFDPKTDLRKEKKLTTPAGVVEFLNEAKGGYRVVGYLDPKEEGITDELMITRDEVNNGIRISVHSSKKDGAKFHQDKELIAVAGNFYGKQGGRLTASVPEHRAEQAIEVILQKGPLYGHTPTMSFKSMQSQIDPPDGGGLYSKLFSKGQTRRTGKWTADDPEAGTGAVSGGLEYDYRFDHEKYEMKPFRILLRRVLDAVAGKGRSARPDVIRDLVKKGLGVPVSEGRVSSPTAAGLFYPDGGTIRTRNKNRISVLAHELGHYIRFRYPETKEFFDKHREEIMALVPTPYNKEPLSVKKEEGFAEFLRLYLTKRKTAYKHAPELSISFATLISKNSQLEAVLEELTALIHAWQGLTGPERFAAKIGSPAFLDKLKNRTMTGLVPHLYSSMNRFVQYWFNPRWSMGLLAQQLRKQIDESGGQEAKFYESDNPDHLMRLLSGWQLKFEKALYRHAVPFKIRDRRDPKKRGISLREALQPVLDLHSNELTAEWGYWMVAKRAEELMNDVSAKHPQGRERLFSRDEINAMLRHYDETYDEQTKKAFEQASRNVKKFQDFFVQYAIDGGYITPEMGDLFRSYMAYIPFHRVKEGKKELKTGKGSPFKQLYGGTSNIADVIENIINNTSNIIHAVDTNYVIIKLLEMSERVNLGGIVEQVQLPPKQVQQSTARVIDRLKAGIRNKSDAEQEYLAEYLETFEKFIEPEMMKELGTMMTFFAPSGKEDLEDRVITARRNGKTIGIKFHEEGGSNADRELGDLLFKSVLSMRPEEINFLEKVLAIGSRIPRAGIVLSPFFQLKNIARDTVTAFFQSDAMKTFIPFWDTAKGLGRVLASKLTNTAEKKRAVEKVLGKKYLDALEKASKEWELAEDMGIGYSDQWLGQYFGEKKFSVVNTKQMDLAEKIKSGLHSFIIRPIEGLEKLGAVAESPSRAEIQKQVYEEKMPSPEQEEMLDEEELEKLKDDAAVLSTVAGRKGAIDFAQKGTGKFPRFLFRSAMFLNPRFQEIVMLFEKAGVRPSAKSVIKISSKVALTTLLRLSIPAMGAMWLATEHEDEEWYKNLPDEAKNLNIYFTENNYYPNPFAWGTLAVRLPMLYMEEYRAKIKSEYGLKPSHMKQFDDAYFKAMLYMIGGLPMLTLPEPWLELLMDEDLFFGYKIEGFYGKYRAKGFIARQNTSEALKQFGYFNPDFPLSPAQLDHLLRGHFTGFADILLYTADAITSSVMDLPVGPSKPFFKTFYSRPEDRSWDKNTIEVPKKLNELIKSIDAYKRYKAKKDVEQMDEYKEVHPLADSDITSRKAVTKRKKRIKELKEQKRRIIEKPDEKYGDKTRDEIADIKRVEINKINAKIKKSYGKIAAYIDKHYDKTIAKREKKELEKELE